MSTAIRTKEATEELESMLKHTIAIARRDAEVGLSMETGNADEYLGDLIDAVDEAEAWISSHDLSEGDSVLSVLQNEISNAHNTINEAG